MSIESMMPSDHSCPSAVSLSLNDKHDKCLVFSGHTLLSSLFFKTSEMPHLTCLVTIHSESFKAGIL